MKLYLVRTRSLESYVLAENAKVAEDTFTNWLNKENYGYTTDREVMCIEVIASTDSKPNTTIYPIPMLLMPDDTEKKETWKDKFESL